MYKKILLSITTLLATGIAFADPAPYAGFGTGIIVNTTKNAGNGQAGYYRGIPLNLFAGYGGFINQGFYLAGEVSATIATATIDSVNGVRTSYGYGISLIPGALLSDHTMAFVRAGMVRSRFSSANGNATGFQVGLGLQTNLTQCVDVRGEYDYTSYRTVHGLSSPRQDAFNIGLVYNFD